MPRRAGKAASRKARQRNVRRAAAPAAPASASAASAAIPPVGTPDAREAASLDPPRRVASPTVFSPGSSLSTRERAEYHYVERDLRNIGILTAAMAVLLFLAWIAFTALNLTS